MDPLLFVLFITATAVLVLTPGPIVGLAIAETLANDTRNGLAVVLGASTVACVFLTINYIGFSVIQGLSDTVLDVIRYAGAAYLIYMAVSAFRSSPNTGMEKQNVKSVGKSYRSALLIAASNPKTILFFAAFFPQFITKELPIDNQLLILSVTFLVVTVVLDSFWVFVAAKAKSVLSQNSNSRLLNRISASVLASGATSLLFLNG